MNLRKNAQDAECSMCGRLDGTTVLHHIRAGGNAGMGTKPPDWHGVNLCHVCHDYVHHEGRADYKLQLIAYQRQWDKWLADGTVIFT